MVGRTMHVVLESQGKPHANALDLCKDASQVMARHQGNICKVVMARHQGHVCKVVMARHQGHICKVMMARHQGHICNVVMASYQAGSHL